MAHKEKASMQNTNNISDANKESIIERLASFDYSSAIQVKVIFEDDEDQSSDPEMEIKAEKTETEDSQKSSDMKIPDEIETGIQVNKESASITEFSPSTSSTGFGVVLNSDRNRKRKLEDHSIVGSNNIQNVTRIDNAFGTGSNPFLGEPIPSTYRATLFREDSRNNVACDHENVDNSNIEMTCITNLLKSVSDHLILILDAYIKLLQLKNRSIDPSEKEKHMSNFRQIKYHFFNLSFCTVDNIILPQENNLLFTGQFLKDTVKLAATQNKTLCLETQVFPLFLELLQWCKQKKNEINKIQIRTGHNIHSNPLLRQHLANPVKPCVSITASNNSNRSVNIQHQEIQENSAAVGNHEHNSLYGDLNRSVSAHINYQLLNTDAHAEHNRSIMLPTQYRSTNPVHHLELRKPNEKHQSEVEKNTSIPTRNSSGKSNSVVFSTGPPERRISISVNQSILESNGNTNNSNSNIRHESEQFYSSKPVLPPTYVETMIQRNQFCLQPSQHNSTNNIQNSMPLGNQNTMAKAMPHWLQNGQDYNESVQMPLALHTQSIQAQIEQQNPEITRSISTDSGFMSPLNFNNPLEMNKDAAEDNPLPSPMITHITSLHPNVSYIREGLCSVCSKVTRKMCVGCYKRYYCSNPCQRFDWNMHKAMCRNS